MNELTLFNFEGKSLRTATVDGEIVWIAKDVAEVLDYVWNGASRIKHVPYQWRGVTSVVTPSGIQDMAYLTEQGLYFFLGRSDKPKALPLQEFVAGEVLPQIRKTGSYNVAPSPVANLNDPHILRQTLLSYTEKVIELENQNQVLKPKAVALDRIAAAVGDLGVRDTGRELEIGQSKVVAYILEHKWACKEGGKLKAAYYGLNNGYVRMCPSLYRDKITGEERVREDFKITRKGIDRIALYIAKKKISNEALRERNSRALELN